MKSYFKQSCLNWLRSEVKLFSLNNLYKQKLIVLVDKHSQKQSKQFASQVLMRRGISKIDFKRKSNDFQQGFGNVSKDYWLGNDRIHSLTDVAGSHQLLRISANTETHIYSQYDNFVMTAKSDDYTLSFDKHNGTSKTGEKQTSGVARGGCGGANAPSQISVVPHLPKTQIGLHIGLGAYIYL